MLDSFFDVCVEYALWIKAFHIIAVISWMAGLFYLPRLFVYHTEHPGAERHETFCMMEEKLYRVIMQPAMHLSLLLGIILSIIQDIWAMPWFHLKCLAVALLVSYHFFLNHCRILLCQHSSPYSGRFFRLLNEVPTVLLILIVLLVVLKPF